MHVDTLTRLDARRGRFLHIVPDDKFIDAARSLFEEAAPGQHDYLTFSRSSTLRHLHTFQPLRMGPAGLLYSGLSKMLPAYSAVFVHFLNDAARLLVASAPSSTRFVWLAWGADYYHLIHSRDDTLLPATRTLLANTGNNSSEKTRAALRLVARQPLNALLRLFVLGRLHAIRAGMTGEVTLLNRFHSMATPIPEDYHSLRNRNPALRVPFVDWHYWTEGLGANSAHRMASSGNILLGNSATPENNHLDALELLANAVPDNCLVYCPLSYGDMTYGDEVARMGKTLLGERFVPLREYMAPAAYAKIVADCSIVAMNHVRQQALGNILLALHNGARVYLNPASPISMTMRGIGVGTHDITTLPFDLSCGETTIAIDEANEIRRKIADGFGRAAILQKTFLLLDKLA